MESSRRSVEENAIAAFRQQFATSPLLVASAPGRVNLIGEHTDYNDGYVLPAAIDRVTAVAVGMRDDKKFDIYSSTLRSRYQTSLADLVPTRAAPWTNYCTGVAFLLQKRGCKVSGVNLAISSTVPRGSGLSSSAALEAATAYALTALFGCSIPDIDIIKLCQQAEHESAGVQCGIMDQFISCLGREHHAMFLDCRTLAYRHVPIPPSAHLLVCDTGVRRALASSEYNKRRAECNTGVELFAQHYPGVTALRDIDIDTFHRHEHSLDPVVRRRCKHVVTENARVEQAVEALLQTDLSTFGKLMYDSHLSLQHDYEVSCEELDAIVDICAEEDGVWGARMTGAGFGGSAICLVDEQHVERVRLRLLDEYPPHTGKTPTVLLCAAGDGAQVRRL